MCYCNVRVYSETLHYHVSNHIIFIANPSTVVPIKELHVFVTKMVMMMLNMQLYPMLACVCICVMLGCVCVFVCMSEKERVLRAKKDL